MPLEPTPPDYVEWAKTHLRTFAIASTENLATFGLWWPAFRAMGCTFNELHAATQTILRGGPAPMKVSDHYHALKMAVASERTSMANRNAQTRIQTGTDRGRCAECDFTTVVTVPHPAHCSAEGWRPARYNAQGDAVYVTAGVLCNRCKPGQDAIARQRSAAAAPGGKPGMMTLDGYEDFVNGNWREQLHDRTEQARAIAEVQSGLTAVDLAPNLASRMRA